MDAIEIFADGSRGIAIPQHFAQTRSSGWDFSDCYPDSIEVLLEGSEHSEYWEAWENVLDNAQYKHGEYTYTLYQDGDLFAICIERMTEDEKLNLFGEID